MAEHATLTVAIPTCNGGRHLAQALRGILSQEGPPFDLIVSDDRSDDDTLNVVRLAAGDRARIEINSERLGLAGNWNRCVALASTEFVTIFHQDDLMHPGHLHAHRAAFDQASGLGMACGAADVIDDLGQVVAPTVVERGDLGAADRRFAPGEFIAELAVGNPVRCSAVTLRKAAHTDVGGFDPTYRYVVDWDFWIRLARRWAVVWLARPTVAIRWHPASETHRFRRGTVDLDETVRLLAGLYETDGANLPAAPSLRRGADRRLARAFLNRSQDALLSGDAPLARRCLRQAVTWNPGILAAMTLDPRLALRMAALSLAPTLATKWLSRGRE